MDTALPADAACVGPKTDAGSPMDAGGPVLAAYAYETWPSGQTCKAFDKNAAPKTLSATGCFDKTDPHKPAPTIFPYRVNAPLWSDASGKDRWMALPDGAKITVENDGDWTFPAGTVLVKGFALKGKNVETRLMVRHMDGEWVGYSYKWRDDDKDADLLTNGDNKFIDGQEWFFPSRAQCLDCHREAAGRTLGPENAQMNAAIVYPNGKYANQIATLDKLGFFAKSPGDPKKLLAYATPTEPASGTLEQRARAYLQGNCSHCHRPNGVKEVSFDLRYGTALKDTGVYDVIPGRNNFGFTDAKLIKPGDPELSMISIRMHSLAPNVRMPQIASNVVDEAGAAVIDAWIKSLAPCP